MTSTWEEGNKCLLEPEWEELTDLSRATSRVQLSEPVNLLGLSVVWVRGYIQEQK